MYLKTLIITALFSALTFGSYYAAMAPLSETSLDEDFFQDLTLLSRFDSKNVGYKNGIETDRLDVRNFFFNNSFNLLWKDKENNSKVTTGNAFLLNVFLPEWITEYHTEYKNYSPNNYVGGDEIVVLLGTSFSFVKHLFPNIKDWKNEVNESISSPTLNNSNKDNKKQFFFSHPWPITTDKTPKLHQTHLYNLENPLYSSFEPGIKQPFFFEIDPKNVELIYAAVDLSINSDLLDININSKRRLQYDLANIQNTKFSRITWQDTIKNVYSKEYKLAVDFAVLKLKFHVNHLKKHFLDYFVNLYKKTQRIPPILNTELEIKNDRTDSIYLGGWEPMSEEEADYHTMENLFIEETIKPGINISSKFPKDCINDQCFDLKLYETYTEKLASKSQKPIESSKYELTDKHWYPNQEDGLLFLKYKIRNKIKNWVSPNYRELVIGNFISYKINSQQAEIIKNYTQEKQIENKKLVSFLEAKPRVYAKWQEYGIKYSYFPFKSLRSHLFAKTFIHKNNKDDKDEEIFNQNKPLTVFNLNGKEYLNIAHHLHVPNMGLRDAKGMIAVTKNPDKHETVMLGMYDGISSWSNPLAGKEKKVGKVTLFISPWRYDLFNSENNLSKPSLGDILLKKNLMNRIVQNNRFRVKKRQQTTKKKV